MVRSAAARTMVAMLLKARCAKEQECATIIIQCWTRGVQQRIVFNALLDSSRLEKKDLSARILQRIVRGWNGRRRFWKELQTHKQQCASMHLQRFARGYKARRSLRAAHSAAKVIGVAWRTLLVQRKNDMQRRVVAAIAIQKWEQQRLQKVRQRCAISAVCVQSAVRCWIACRWKSHTLQSCIRIQNFARSALARAALDRRKCEEGFCVDGNLREGHDFEDDDDDDEEEEEENEDAMRMEKEGNNKNSHKIVKEKEKDHTVEENQEDRSGFIRPPRCVAMTPSATFASFSHEGLVLSSKVLAAVQIAEEVAAKVERELMGIHTTAHDQNEMENMEVESDLLHQLRLQMEWSSLRYASVASWEEI